MKKIKGLLLFGILTLLGIGSSFGYQTYMQSILYKDNINQHISFNVFAGNSNVTSYSVSSINSNGNVVSVPFLYNTSNSLNFNIGNYSISDNLNTYSYNAVGLYGNDSCLDLYYSGTSRSLLFHLFGENNCNSSSNYIGRSTYGIYINTNQSCVYSGVMTTGCNHNFYKIFSSQTYDSRIGQYQDSNYSGNNIAKSSISISFPDVYSFFTRYDLTSGGTVTQGNYDKFRFKTVYRSGDSFVGLPGVYMIRLNDYRSNYTITGFQVMVFSLTGVFDDSDITNNTFYYSIYNCPYDSNYITDCQFSNNGGTFNWSFSSYLFTGNIFSFFTSNITSYSRIMTNSYNGINLVFHRPGTTSNYGYHDYSFSVGLTSDGNNYFQDLFSGNIGNLSSGTNTSSMYYNCLGPYYNTSDGLPPAYCYDSSGNLNPQRFDSCFDTIEQVPEGGAISHTYCIINGFLQEVGLVPDGSGYSIVPGTNTTNILEFFNEGYSTGYFENFLNTTGYFFRCPFPYSESLTVRPKLISMMNGFDINLPINCAFAGYSQGKQVFTFEHSGHLIQGGPLLNFEGDNRKLLYTFFDILIILGLLFFFGKILKFFS